MKTDKEKQAMGNMLIEVLLAVDETEVSHLCSTLSCPTTNCSNCPLDSQDNLAATLQYLEVKNVA